MNAFRTSLALASALLLVACDKIPQPKRIQATNEIEIDLLVVRLAESRAVKLLPALRDRKRAESATKEILKLIETGDAALIAWPVLATKSGQRAVVEQIDEFRYATEFDPPQHAKVHETDAGEPGALEPPVVPVDPKTETPTPPRPITTKDTETFNEMAPTAFETRNVGVTFEVEPNIGLNGRTIDLNMVPQHVRLRGMRKVTTEGPRPGDQVTVEVPQFIAHKVTTSISVEDGDYTLLGVFTVADMPGQVELFILHTRIKRVEVPASELPPGAPTPVTLMPLGGK